MYEKARFKLIKLIETGVISKKRIHLISLTVFVLLFSSWLYNYYNPSFNYPEGELRNRVPVSHLNQTILDEDFFESLIFTNYSINTKVSYNVIINNVDPIDISISNEVEIIFREIIVTYEVTEFLLFGEVENLEVTINGLRIDTPIVEINGHTVYSIPITELKSGNIRNQILYSYDLKTNCNYSKLISKPFFFTKKYSPMIHLPITSIPVKYDEETETIRVKISRESVLYDVSKEASGWKEICIPEMNELDIYEINDHLILKLEYFEYPLNQQKDKIDTGYLYRVNLSEHNYPNHFTIIFKPDISTVFLPIFIIVSTYMPYIPKVSDRFKDSSLFEKIGSRYLFAIFGSYALFFSTDYERLIGLANFMFTIYNSIFLLFVILFPVIYTVIIDFVDKKDSPPFAMFVSW